MGRIWRPYFSSTAQVMIYCLMAPSHYLKQCWHFIKAGLWYSHDGNLSWNTRDISLSLCVMSLKITSWGPMSQFSVHFLQVIKDDMWPNPLQYFLAPDIEVEENGIARYAVLLFFFSLYAWTYYLLSVTNHIQAFNLVDPIHKLSILV